MASTRVQTRRGAQWVETRLFGRVLAEDIVAMADEFVARGAGTVWLVDATAAESYDPAAIRDAVEAFSRLSREHGLERLVAWIARPSVRMGASVVAMSLRAIGARMQIVIVEDADGFARAGA